MAHTSLANMFIPEVFGAYVQKQSTKTNRFLNSGIMTQNTDPQFMANLIAGGYTIEVPYFNVLTGEVQVWSDKKDIDVNGITTGTQRGVKLYETQAFGVTDKSGVVAGADPKSSIITQFADYWNEVDAQTMFYTLNGTFKNADIATAKLYDGSTDVFTPRGFLATKSRMGDIADAVLGKIAVHSSTYNQMLADNLIQTVMPTNALAPISVYNNMEVIQDDSIPLDGDVTTSYIFAPNAVSYQATQAPSNGMEVVREALKNGGQEAIVQRRIAQIQVVGTSLKTGYAPTTELSTADMAGDIWDFAGSDPREMRVVAYKHKVSKDFIVPSKSQTPASAPAQTSK